MGESVAQSVQLLAKVLGLSLGLSLLIKYVGPFIPIPATSGVALALVLLPCIMMMGLLGWRALHGNQSNY